MQSKHHFFDTICCMTGEITQLQWYVKLWNWSGVLLPFPLAHENDLLLLLKTIENEYSNWRRSSVAFIYQCNDPDIQDAGQPSDFKTSLCVETREHNTCTSTCQTTVLLNFFLFYFVAHFFLLWAEVQSQMSWRVLLKKSAPSDW